MGICRKDAFDLPDGVIYLDGNSLGPLPKSVSGRLSSVVQDEWGDELIRAWNVAGWMELPGRVGDQIAPLIGAPPGTVSAGDTLSIKLFQALSAALQLRPDRKIILTDDGNFPTDLYIAQGLIKALGQGHALKMLPPEAISDAIDEMVAVVMLTHADYRTARLYDMAAITQKAHRAGALVIWDLAHSAGAVPADVAGCHADFAVGCTYKYLNGGPGSPAFIYARPDIAAQTAPILSGWMGHAAPFDMVPGYAPAGGIERFRIGTPPVLQLSVLSAALELWQGVDMAAVRARSIELSELMITEIDARCPMLDLISPRDPARRGSHLSFAFEHGYAAAQALIARGVIGDFRNPNLMRFGITPLFLDEADILAAVGHIEAVMRDKLWQDPKFMIRAKVT